MSEPRHDHNGECLRCDEPWGSCTCGCPCRERAQAAIAAGMMGHLVIALIKRTIRDEWRLIDQPIDDAWAIDAIGRFARRAAHFAAESLKL